MNIKSSRHSQCENDGIFFRTCLHKKCVRIFEHNFVADKAKIRRRAVARQVFFTQYAAKFAEKTRVYACEDRFSECLVTGFICTDPDALFHRRDEDFSVPHRSGIGDFLDQL